MEFKCFLSESLGKIFGKITNFKNKNYLWWFLSSLPWGLGGHSLTFLLFKALWGELCFVVSFCFNFFFPFVEWLFFVRGAVCWGWGLFQKGGGETFFIGPQSFSPWGLQNQKNFFLTKKKKTQKRFPLQKLDWDIFKKNFWASGGGMKGGGGGERGILPTKIQKWGQ